jgi:hypothetical protein
LALRSLSFGLLLSFGAYPSVEINGGSSQLNSPQANRRFEFDKRSHFFIRSHNETLSVIAMIPLPKCRMIRGQ